MEWIGVRNKLTANEIKNITKAQGIKLPEDYCAKIGEINGGRLKKAFINVKGIGDVAYSGNLNLLESARGNAIVLYKILQNRNVGGFPFGDVGNGDYFCFDMSNGSVFLWMHETEKKAYICDSFSNFLDKLEQR